MSKGYSLEWLDKLVTVTLNPEKTGLTNITPDEAAKIQSQVIAQKDKVQSAIKYALFDLKDETEIRCLIKKYHSSLISLSGQALEDQAILSGSSPLKQVLETVISCIDEVLSLIEGRFIYYLSADERVPATYFEVVKKEWIELLSVVDKKLQGHQDRLAFKILQQELLTFLTPPYNKHTCIFQEIFYIRDLCVELERLEPVDEAAVYSGLDKVLIHMNFNCKTYIDDLTQRLAANLNNIEQIGEKMDRLLFYRKLFKQYSKKPGVIFNSKEAGLHSQLVYSGSTLFEKEDALFNYSLKRSCCTQRRD